MEARNLRNRLIPEYLQDPDDFAAALQRARQRVALLVETHRQLVAAVRRVE